MKPYHRTLIFITLCYTVPFYPPCATQTAPASCSSEPKAVCSPPGSQPPVQPALNATGNSPSLWGPKANQTIRLAASLTDNTDIMSDQARQGYEFWAYTLNQLHKGFQIGLANSSRQITVDLRFMTDNLDPVRHGMNMIAAVREGSTDFLLGGNTNLAWQDFNASVASERITMLCCHGPPTVYQTAAALGQSGFNPNTSLKAQDYLFGIQYNSEQYTTALIHQIALNQKAKMIAIVARTSVDPNQNLFANTTCQAAVNQIKAIFTSGQYSAPPNYRLFNTDASQENNLTYFRELAKVIRNETVNGVHYDMVLGCTLEKDGKNLLAALQLEMVPLKAVFATFAPSRASIVEELAQCQNITMADTLTAGQWHPQLPFVDQNPGVLWPSATAFASAFQIHNPLLTVTYTHAAAAAACFALQTAFVQAFKSCDLTDWNGDTDELLYSDKWMCEAMAPGMTMKTGYDMVLYSLRNLRRDSFYGPLQFDDIQQNSGRDTVTLQLQATPNVATASVVGSVNFGCDADGKTLLLEQIVLPSDYETKSIIMPRPPRPYDRPCPDGQGLDANNDCQPCAPGTARGGIGSVSSDAWNCYSCNLTSYADAPGMAQCTACPQGTQTNVLGADSIAMCSCMSGYYNETGLTGVPCSACPRGASCPGGVAPPQALPGYWTNSSSPNTLADVFACSPPQSCLNDPITGQTCATGWGGNICSLCGYANKESGTQKYFLVFGSCVVCNSKAAAFFAFVAVLILWILINLFIGMNWESVALAVDWLQMMSLVGNINANWPMSLQFFFNLAQFFAFEVSVVSWECVAPSWNFLYDMILQFSLPIFLISCWLALGGLHLCLKRLRKRYLEKGLEKEVVEDLVLEGSPEDGISKIDHNAGTSLYHKAFGSITSATIAASAITSGFDRFDWSRDAIIGRVLNILEITYLASTLYAMSALRSISVSGESVLANYPYTVQTTAVIVVGAVGLVLFSIAFPLFLIIKLWTLSPDSLWRRTLYGDTYRRLEDPGGFRKEENIKMLGWLYEKFRVERYYMAHMHLLHRFVFIAAISFVVDPAIQLVLTISFTLMFAALFIMTRPYFLPRLNILQAVLYMSIVFILGCGAAFYSPYASYEGAQWNTAFEVLGFVIIGGGGLVFGWIATVEILENLCSILAKEALYQEAESTSRQVGEAQVKALAEIFSSVRLWSWIQEQELRKTGKRLRQSKLLWCAFRRYFRSQPKVVLVPTGPDGTKDDDPVDLFMKVAFNMREYLNDENMLSTLSTVGDAVLWRQLVAEYPELLAFLYNESDDVASHWNTFFRVFYGWYWRIHDLRADNREVWAPLVRKLSGVRLRRNRKHNLDKMGKVPAHCNPCSEHVMTVTHRMRQTPPEVHNVSRLFKRENLAMVANWLAWRSEKSLERRQFAELVKSIGLSKHVCWEEKVFRLMNFSLPSWFRQGGQRSSKALSPVFQLLERSRGEDPQGGEVSEVAGEFQSLQSNGSVLGDLNLTGSGSGRPNGVQRFHRSVTGDSAWTTATHSSG